MLQGVNVTSIAETPVEESHNKYEDNLSNLAGEGTTTTYAPSHSARDNIIYIADSSTQVTNVLGTQNHAGGTVPYGYVQTREEHIQEYHRHIKLAESHRQAAMQAGASQQEFIYSTIPRITNQQYDHLGNIANNPGQANQPYNLNSHVQSQHLRPRPYEQVMHNPQYVVSIPQQIPSSGNSWTPGLQHYQGHNMLASPAIYLNQSTQLPGLVAGQGPGLPESGAPVAQQIQLQQHQYPNASTSLPQQQLPISTHPPNYVAQAPLLQHSPLPSLSGVFQCPPLATSASPSSDLLDGMSNAKEDLAQPTFPAKPTSHPFESNITSRTDLKSGKSTISIVIIPSPTFELQAAPSSFAYENPTARPVPASMPFSYAPAAPPVAPNHPLPSRPPGGVTAAPPVPIYRPAGNNIPIAQQNESIINKGEGIFIGPQAQGP